MTKPDLMAELAAQSKWLRKAAAEIAAAGHAGWGNTCLQAAETIDAHHAELEAVVRDAGYWRKLMQWHDAPKGNKYATVVFWESEPHEPENALELVNAMNRAMHNSAREG